MPLISEFDALLLDNARDHGADVREEHAVTDVDTSGPTPVVRACARDGAELRLTPRFVVDASGQSALLGRKHAYRQFNEFFKNLAVFGYFRVDNATRGYYTGRLQFLSAAAILAIVGAGVFCARWIYWL